MPETTDTIAAGELNKLELTPEMLGATSEAPVLDENAGDVMAAPNTVRMQNMVDIEQFVYVEGRKWTLAPFQISPLPERVAREFRRERARYVRQYAREPGYIEQGEPITWMANATGNPFIPDKIEREVVRKGVVSYEEIDNPIKRPRHLKWSLHTGQKVIEVDTGDGLEKKALNFPPKVFELAPFERKPFAGQYAQRALEREGFCEIHDQGKMVSCRPPEPGEPNGTWSYEELRLYAEMMDKNTFLPMLVSDEPRKNPPKFPESVKKDAHREELKAELLTYLFFRLIDSRFPTVPYEVFEAERRNRRISASE